METRLMAERELLPITVSAAMYKDLVPHFAAAKGWEEEPGMNLTPEELFEEQSDYVRSAVHEVISDWVAEGFAEINTLELIEQRKQLEAQVEQIAEGLKQYVPTQIQVT